MKMKYFVYILESLKNGKYYIGYSSNLEKRLVRHNQGKTKGNRANAPFKLVFKEEFANSTEARKKELYIKKQKSRVFIQKLIANGAVAQLGERGVRNAEAVGSIPISSI